MLLIETVLLVHDVRRSTERVLFSDSHLGLRKLHFRFYVKGCAYVAERFVSEVIRTCRKLHLHLCTGSCQQQQLEGFVSGVLRS